MSPDRDALVQLYQAQFGALLAHLQRLLGQRALAEDLAQQAGLRLLELDPAQLARIREPRAFLFQVATNLARDALRRRSTASAGQAELVRAGPQHDPGPEALACSLQELDQVRTAIGQLPPQARSVLLLARVEGLSHKEIAVRMGLQPKTVENYLARALAALAQRLAGLRR